VNWFGRTVISILVFFGRRLLLILLYLMINILANRFIFTQKVDVFLKAEKESEKEISNILNKFDWVDPFRLRINVFSRIFREELSDG
jgi:hypothetical protein